MKMLDLLNKYKKAADVINAHFTKKMIDSFENDDEVPEEFKEFMKQRGVDNENLAKMLDVSPRALFDVFDENGLFIQIEGDNKNGWSWEVGSAIENSVCSSRIEAEAKAVETAARLLNNKLEQHERLDSGTSGEQVSEKE